MNETNGRTRSDEATLNHEATLRIEAIVNQYVHNQEQFRTRFFEKFFNNANRAIDEECQYPSTGQLSPQYYRDLYDREPIAARVVQVLPMESWQVTPSVYDRKDKDSPFNDAWKELGNTLRGGASWFKQEIGSPVWDHLLRADILSGIGGFGVILMGVDDGKTLDQPIDGLMTVNRKSVPVTKMVFNRTTSEREERQIGTRMVKVGELPVMPDSPIHDDEAKAIAELKLTANERRVLDVWIEQREKMTQNVAFHAEELNAGVGDRNYMLGAGTEQQYFGVVGGPSEMIGPPSKKEHKLLFLRPFDESLVQIVRYEWNVRNPRFGMPVIYRITLNDPREQHSGIGLPLATVFVHWTRVIHLADNRGSSEVFGVPRMRPVLNPILDLRKVRGAGAEGYWKSCFTGLQFSTHPQLGGDVEVDTQEVKDAYEKYVRGLQRGLVAKGGVWSTIAPSVVDPTPHRDGCIRDICIQKAIPVRVFEGTERGQLASVQDDSQWNDVCRQRENGYCTPGIIVPFVDRCISIGALPEPDEDDGYFIEWPDLDSLSDLQKATIALTETQAIAAFVQGDVETLMTPKAYMTKVLGWESEEVEEYLLDAAKAQEEKEQDHQDIADEHGMVPEPPPGFQHPEPEPPPVPPPAPIKVKPGEKLVQPPTPKLPTANVEAEIEQLRQEFDLSDAEVRQLRSIAINYDPDEARDGKGQWTGSGGLGETISKGMDKVAGVFKSLLSKIKIGGTGGRAEAIASTLKTGSSAPATEDKDESSKGIKLRDVKLATFGKHIGDAKDTLAKSGITDMHGTNLQTHAGLRSMAVNKPHEFDQHVTKVEDSLKSAHHFSTDEGQRSAVTQKLKELAGLKADVDKFRNVETPEIIAHWNKRGAGAINTKMAVEHLASGGTTKSAVEHVMKNGGVGRGTAQRYVREAVKQGKTHNAETKLKLYKERDDAAA